jgi:hypothetical protein
MDLRRLRAGEWIVALSGIGLFVSLFLPWYGYEAARPGLQVVGAHATGWEAFAVTDVLLAVLAAFGPALWLVTASQRTVPIPVALAGLTAFAGTIAVVLAVVRVLVVVAPGGPIDTTRGAGAWVGLASAAGLAVGGWVAMRDERLSKPGRPTDATGKPSPPPPEIDPIPAPRP